MILDEKRLNELKGEFIDQCLYAEQVLEKYIRGEAKLEQVNTELSKLNELEGQISVVVGSAVRAYYLNVIEAKKARESKNIQELGYQP